MTSVSIIYIISNIPNPDIENTIIAQLIDTPRKPIKIFITNKVTLVFLDFLCISSNCTLKRFSISGFGNIVKSQDEKNKAPVIAIKKHLEQAKACLFYNIIRIVHISRNYRRTHNKQANYQLFGLCFGFIPMFNTVINSDRIKDEDNYAHDFFVFA